MSISYSEYYNLKLQDFDRKKKDLEQLVKSYEGRLKEAQQPGSKFNLEVIEEKVQRYKDDLEAVKRIEKERKSEVRKANY